jgi:hypothetical protein
MVFAITIQDPEVFDVCMNELKDDGLIKYDNRAGL